MQDLTPLEIQKQVFARAVRGFHRDEVRAYLHLVAEEIERLLKDVDRLSRENAMLRDELTHIKYCFTTADVAEAMTAFREKRLPSFKGR